MKYILAQYEIEKIEAEDIILASGNKENDDGSTDGEYEEEW